MESIKTEAYIRIPHFIEERIMLSNFSSPKSRIVDLVKRVSLGCGKTWAYIPRQSDFEAAGIGEGHIKENIDWLIQACVIIREGCYYSLNKNVDQWQISQAKNRFSQKLIKLVGLNLRTPDPGCGRPLPGPATAGAAKITKMVNGKLPNGEVPTYGKGKLPTPVSASPKEIVNKYINKGDKYLDDSSVDGTKIEERACREASENWTKVLELLRPQVNTTNYNTWLADSRGLLCRDGVFLISVPNAFVAQYLDANLRSLIEKTIIDVTGERKVISFKF